MDRCNNIPGYGNGGIGGTGTMGYIGIIGGGKPIGG